GAIEVVDIWTAYTPVIRTPEMIDLGLVFKYCAVVEACHSIQTEAKQQSAYALSFTLIRSRGSIARHTRQVKSARSPPCGRAWHRKDSTRVRAHASRLRLRPSHTPLRASQRNLRARRRSGSRQATATDARKCRRSGED